MLKLLKTKFATAFVLAALMFGMFSFTTTPVVAQDTTSEIVLESDVETAALPAVLLGAAVRGFLWGAAVGLAYKAYQHLSGNSQLEQGDLPADSLDF